MRGGLPGNITMRGAMEAVTADAMAFIPILRKCIAKCIGRQRLMKSRVEHCDLGNFRGRLQGNLDSQKVGRIVKGCQRDQITDSRHNLGVDNGRFAEFFTTVDHPMADAEKLTGVADRARLVKNSTDERKPFLVAGYLLSSKDLIPCATGVAREMGELALRFTDLFQQTFGQHCLI